MSRSRRNAKTDEYFRRAPNYSAEVIDRFRNRAHRPLAQPCLSWFADLLECTTKFALPFGGRFFSQTPPLSDIEGWRPPYPLTAFEFDANGTGPDDPMTPLPDPVPVVCLAVEGRGWIFLYMFLRQPEMGWQPQPFWCAFQRDHVNGPVTPGDVFPEMALGVIGGGICFGILPGVPEGLMDRLGVARGNLAQIANEYMAPGLIATIQASAVLSCTNVTTEVIRPTREARAARPESTLFDYHVLMIRPGAERHEGPPLGGSHASPRTHLRRGHIRQHPTAGRIWVNSCVVNPTAIGSVNKDYQLQGGIQ